MDTQSESKQSEPSQNQTPDLSENEIHEMIKHYEFVGSDASKTYGEMCEAEKKKEEAQRDLDKYIFDQTTSGNNDYYTTEEYSFLYETYQNSQKEYLFKRACYKQANSYHEELTHELESYL